MKNEDLYILTQSQKPENTNQNFVTILGIYSKDQIQKRLEEEQKRIETCIIIRLNDTWKTEEDPYEDTTRYTIETVETRSQIKQQITLSISKVNKNQSVRLSI